MGHGLSGPRCHFRVKKSAEHANSGTKGVNFAAAKSVAIGENRINIFVTAKGYFRLIIVVA